jgi:iron complex transport system substrate-binding protein
VAVVEWLDPPILAGLWTPDIVALAGGASVGPAPGAPGIRTTWSDLASQPIDLLILSPCSFTVERTIDEFRNAELRRAVERLAPRLGTFVADEAYFSRPGPRLAEGVRLVRDLIAGELVAHPMPVKLLRPELPRATA